jgi:hypothetical protein
VHEKIMTPLRILIVPLQWKWQARSETQREWETERETERDAVRLQE